MSEPARRSGAGRRRESLLRGLVALVAVLASGTAAAGALYGSLKRGEQPLPAVPLKLICGGQSVTGESDAQGNYRLAIPGMGRCALTVGNKAVAVVLGDDAARYDFEVPADAAPLRRR